MSEGGICPHCQFGIGNRTSVPLEVSGLPKGDIAGVDCTFPPSLLILGVSPERWKDLSSRKGTTGISTGNLYVIDDGVAVTAPVLSMPEQFDWIL